jgi:hypothetical protein
LVVEVDNMKLPDIAKSAVALRNEKENESEEA